ncbi:metallophosphoesterase family protein [Thaumasiovibrio subtropicus]|uniref:metallophosphoesterase family protein n=1 Tax=Thaumasiovibrio subtropicus TaxID=1891207 RepID=UPI000B357E0E|nr:metallophosphoesterase [Thaumasiovibrio subtropicus]
MSTIYQISDCHLHDETSYHHLAKALTLANNDKASTHILFTGDICCGPVSGCYRTFAKFVSQYAQQQAMYAIPGNHDDNRLMQSELRDTAINVTQKVRIDERDFCFIDTSDKPLSPRLPLGSGRVNRRELSRLRKQLQRAIKPVVVLHHPVLPVGADWMKAIRLENDETLLKVLAKYSVKEVICGHGHASIVEKRHNVTQYMAPSTAFGFDHSIRQYNRNDRIGVHKINLGQDALQVEFISI